MREGKLLSLRYSIFGSILAVVADSALSTNVPEVWVHAFNLMAKGTAEFRLMHLLTIDVHGGECI